MFALLSRVILIYGIVCNSMRWYKAPCYRHWRFSASQRRYFDDLLQEHEVWENRRLVGPKSSKHRQCILVDDHPFHNPFYPVTGPANLDPQQIKFLVKFGFLPNNKYIRKKRNQIDLSHVCGRSDCVNVDKGHIVAEEHWRNKLRQIHHNIIDNLFKAICNRITEALSKASKRMLRSNSKPQFCTECVEIPQEDDICTCEPRCFKNCDEKESCSDEQ